MIHSRTASLGHNIKEVGYCTKKDRDAKECITLTSREVLTKLHATDSLALAGGRGRFNSADYDDGWGGGRERNNSFVILQNKLIVSRFESWGLDYGEINISPIRIPIKIIFSGV